MKFPLKPKRKFQFVELSEDKLEKIYQMRGRLINSSYQFTTKKVGKIAYLGGSITQNPGWRDLVSQYIKNKFKSYKTKFIIINAGISSTGSNYGAFRLERDIFSKQIPDVLFVEFAVNDLYNRKTDEEQIRGMEGIIVQCLKKNHFMDIILLYCADPIKIDNYNNNQVPQIIKNYEKVADRYSVSSINLALDVVERLKNNEFSWKKDFKDLHPSPFGQTLYYTVIKRYLDSEWDTLDFDNLNSKSKDLSLKLIDSASFCNPQLISPNKLPETEGWTLYSTAQNIFHSVRPHYKKLPCLECVSYNKPFTYNFEGKLIGMHIISSYDAGIIEYSIDGNGSKEIDLYTQWSATVHLPWTIILQADLPQGNHTVTIHLKQNSNKKSKGTALRIVYLLTN